MPAPPTLSLERRLPGVVVLWMDDPKAPVNTLRRELIDEFESVLEEIEGLTGLEVLVFASRKPDSFIAGANLQMLLDLERAEQGQELSEISQNVQNRIASLSAVSVAAIHGTCLGGGLELALAFDRRIASDDAVTRLGLPEVKLGLLPGGGGTQRLIPLVGIERALDLLLTGRQLAATKAREVGLVDRTVPRELLIDAAIRCAREVSTQGPQRLPWSGRRGRAEMLKSLILERTPWGRQLVFGKAQKRVLQKTHGHYPAPERILSVVRHGLEEGIGAGLAAEARAFGELAVSPQARQLINLFFAGNALKKDTGIGKRRSKPRSVEKLGVIGAGLMGAGISFVALSRAHIPVRLRDRDATALARGLTSIHRLLDERVARRSITDLARSQLLAGLSATTDFSGFANCDLVVEAVSEDRELKRQILAQAEDLGHDEMIFASNTSAIPIAEVAADCRRPEQVIGMHYFSPVERMPLLEVVVTHRTSPWVTATCVAFAKRQGKTVIVVNDGPGFYTTRVLGAYINEAVRLLIEGSAIDAIDKALEAFGFPMGPMALLDEVGLDVARHVSETLHQAFGDRLRPARGVERLLHEGRLGRKSGTGMYRYDDSVKKGEKKVDDFVYKLLDIAPRRDFPAQLLADRCALQMLNEAAHCLGEKIVRSPRDADIGAVFGLGFPPFRGGPFRYIDARGPRAVVNDLESLADEHGERFLPAPLLREAARKNRRFYA